MAKAKSTGSETPNELGLTETQAQAITRLREQRAKLKAEKGGEKPRVITNYHDAERLFRLGALSPEEVVDLEDRGLLSADVLRAGGVALEGDDEVTA